jgi:hypothetical protein
LQNTIDLVFGSELVSNWLIEYQAREDLDYSSDYYPIATRLEIKLQYTLPIQARNWKKIDKEQVALEAQDLHWLPARQPTTASLDVYADYIISFTQDLISRTVPWKKPSLRVTL